MADQLAPREVTVVSGTGYLYLTIDDTSDYTVLPSEQRYILLQALDTVNALNDLAIPVTTGYFNFADKTLKFTGLTGDLDPDAASHGDTLYIEYGENVDLTD